MYGMRPSTPSCAIAAGVLATGKSFAVALFTPLSVACADSTTATSSSNGVACSSSVVGIGLASRRRSKIARRFAGFTAPCRRASVGEAREPRRLVRRELASSLSSACALPPTVAAVVVAARERDLGELLVDVAVGLAGALRVSAASARWIRFASSSRPSGAIAARDRPLRDADRARRCRIASRSGKRLLPVRRARVSASPRSKYVQPMLL